MSVKQSLKIAVGRVGNTLAPGLAQQIETGGGRGNGSFLTSAMIEARKARASEKGDWDGLSTSLGAFWKSARADSFYTNYVAERRATFETCHAGILPRVAALMADRPGAFTRLVEIGCGDGDVLERLAAACPGLTQCIGIDVNAAVVEANRARPQDPRITYHCTDGLDWLRDNPAAGTLLVTYGGVLEYFAEAGVLNLLRLVSQGAPGAALLVEPVAPEHDLAVTRTSFPFGRETSFSHHHADLLSRAGMEVVWQKELTAEGVRWMMILGATPA